MSLGIVILVSGGALAGTLIAHVIANKRRVTARPFTVLLNSPSSITSRGHFASKRLLCKCRRSRPASLCQADTVPKVVRQPIPHPDWVAEEGVKQPHPYDGQPFTALDPEVRRQ